MHRSITSAFLMASLLYTQCAPAQDSAADFGTPISTTIIVPFAHGSTRFQPGPVEAAYLADAKRAALITIRGRTSTARPSAKDEVLALTRAISARSYFISRGVSPLKISINYVSAGDFVADNSTPEGRLENQRVEIELVYVMPLGQPMAKR